MLVLIMVLVLLTLPFSVPVTLAVGEHTLVVRPWGPRSQWLWSPTPNWGVTTVTFAGPAHINIYGKESALFRFEGKINAHLVRIANWGFSWGWWKGKKIKDPPGSEGWWKKQKANKPLGSDG
jgi:hypothetical protein